MMMSDYSSAKNDRAEFDGQQHVAPGSGTAEGYSREGLDADTHITHHRADLTKDPMKGSSGIPSMSTANKGNGHHFHQNGMVVMGGEHQSARLGGGGQHERKKDQPGQFKGHDESQSLVRGIGNLVKRARRGVNSYFSALARQQVKLARQQRERERKKSSNFDFLEEGVSLLQGDGEGNGNGDGNDGGTLHRSQSEVFVAQSPPQKSSVVLETASADAASNAVEMGDFSEAARLLGDDDTGHESRNGLEAGLGTMKRGGRARLTTGDLVRLYREERQGAGEDSAQDEDRQRTSKGNSVGGRRWWWGLKPRQQGAAHLMPRLSDRRSNVEQWKRDQDEWAHLGFKVLGVEIGHLPVNQQVALLAGGVFFFLLIYGYMQEYLVVRIFKRKFGLFMTFLQFIGYAGCAALRRALHRETGRKIPLRTYAGLGFLQAVMQGLTNVSMMYLNYPAKVLFKSSRMVPIMCFGVVWQGRRYSMRDCLVVCCIVTGLATFMNAETRSSVNSDTPFSLLGVACISLALMIDAANINIQEEVMNRYASCQDELIMFSYLCGTVFVASFCMFSGELISGILFLHEKGMWAIGAVMMYCASGFLGGSCAVALTKRFGALHSAITTTARKAVTLMLSFAYFQKAFTLQHLVGATVFMVGLMTKMFGKERKPAAPTGQSANTSPAVTPFVNSNYRKQLSIEEHDRYNSSGSGSDTCNGQVALGSTDSTRTQSPSPVSQEGSAALTANSGGYPVRHRGVLK